MFFAYFTFCRFAFFVCPQTSFNSVFLCRLAVFVVRAMQETQPTRSKAKFQLNQQTVQTDGEPSKRTSEQTNEPSVDCDDDVGKQRECEQRRPNEEQQTEIEIHNTHTHTRTTGRANMHTHRHAGAHVSFRFVRFCCWWVDWSLLLLPRQTSLRRLQRC